MSRLLCFAALFAGLALLTYNAATTNVWDDETNGFFLSRQPVSTLIDLMAQNVHEDPPLFDLMLHAWQKVAGYDPFALRLPSIIFWLLTLYGIKRIGDLLGEKGAGLLCMVVAVLMPYHWMFPAAMRWYSFFACLATWNALTFIVLIRKREKSDGSMKECLPTLVGYIATGAAMWYTNYGAPALFLAHGICVLLVTRCRWRILFPLGCAWAGIGMLYLPWLAVFFRQLHHSAQPFSASFTLASLYALWAGEVSTPYAWWISIPLLIVAASAAVLVSLRWRQTAVIAILAVFVLAVLVFKNVIWTKRLLLVTPFFAVAIGLALSSLPDRGRVWYLRSRAVFLTAAAIALIGSLYNCLRGEGWMTYRWLQPTDVAVATAKGEFPNAVLLTNSNSVAFYAQDPVGFNLVSLFPDKIHQAVALPWHQNLPAQTLEVVQQRLANAQEVTYLHESASMPYSGIKEWLQSTMQSMGYAQSDIHSYAEVSAEYLRHHPGSRADMSLLDRCRLVVVTFKRTTTNQP